jgi:nicotinate-nucleotide adenylyltransferase
MASLSLYFGGTFNPVHVGHTRLALECHMHTGARVMFVPCGDPPLKSNPQIAVAHRLAMLDLAVAELNRLVPHPVFAVEPWETETSGPSYTFNTLQALRHRYPFGVLAWVIGMDSLVDLHLWHRWQELTDVANLLVINRPGWERPVDGPVAEWLAPRECPFELFSNSGGVAFLETTPLPISSSQLRRQLADALPGKYLIPDPVCEYIHRHQLYSSTQH